MDALTTCHWCGETHGVKCPYVKSIEYYESGEVKKVEFFSLAEMTSSLIYNPLPYGPPTNPPPYVPGYPYTVTWKSSTAETF